MLDIRPGNAPPVVLRTLLDHLSATGHHIDGHDLDVVAGTPRLYVRFVVPESNDAEEDAVAFTVADSARKAVDAVAVPGRVWVLRRRRGTWIPARWTRTPLVRNDGLADEGLFDEEFESPW